MYYQISKKLYSILLKGLPAKRGWIIEPLLTHEAVVKYIKTDSGLKNIIDVIVK